MKRARIIGTGSYVGDNIITNKDLEKRYDTSEEWINKHLGIRTRRVARDNQVTSDLAYEAAKNALDMAGLKPRDIDLIILATCTPDHLFPGTSLMVQKKLEAGRAAVFDMKAQCAGFIHLATVGAQMAVGDFNNVLVIAAELIINGGLIDPEDRISNCLFGDGASAMVLTQSDDEEKGILSYYLGSNPIFYDYGVIPAGGTANKLNMEELKKGNNYLKHKLSTSGNKNDEDIEFAMDAKSFEGAFIKHALVESMNISLDKADKKPSDLDFFIPHPGNMNNYKAVLEKLNIPASKSYVVLDKYGNSSGPQIGIALDEAIRAGHIKENDLVSMTGIGMGMQYGSLLFCY